MSKNANLGAAKIGKKDEFYTQYSDIEAEINAYVEFNPNVFQGKTILCPCDDPETSHFIRYFIANFAKLGLKKLISTSYARSAGNRSPSLFEISSPNYDLAKHEVRGRMYTLTSDQNGDGKIDIDDLQWVYLEEDGDFRSKEVTCLRDEADFIITNPPFSLFREFLEWIIAGKKGFSIIGNQNAITYKEVFPLLKENIVWLGQGFKNNVGFFYAPEYEDYAVAGDHKKGFIRVSGVMWFTNIDFARRHQPLELTTMAENLKYNKKLRRKFEEEYSCNCYPFYDNYDAIEVPFTECIPSDYEGVMGVPITFLDKYCPEQFEILGITDRQDSYNFRTHKYTKEEYSNANDLNARACIMVNNKPKPIYARILIQKGKRQ